MDKDFMQINEKELTDVVGGRGADACTDRSFNRSAQQEFLNMATANEAVEFLRGYNIYPSSSSFRSWMKQWEEKHK